MRIMKPRYLVAILFLVTIAVLFLLGAAGRRGPAAPKAAAPEQTTEPPGLSDPVPGATAARVAPVTGSAPVADAPAAQSAAAPVPAARGQAGMIAAIDPETGRLTRPSRAQRAALTESMGSAVEPVGGDAPAIALPGGGEVVHVGERFMEYAVARVDSTGHIRTDCVPGAQVQERLTEPVTTAPARVREER